ncbi:MAG: hypothetical protein EOP67_01940, partial [Sphingomonas sp.]
LVYHARDYEAIKGDPLFDPNRHTRVQRFTYKPAARNVRRSRPLTAAGRLRPVRRNRGCRRACT